MAPVRPRDPIGSEALVERRRHVRKDAGREMPVQRLQEAAHRVDTVGATECHQRRRRRCRVQKTEGLERFGPPSEPARPRTEERIEITDLVDVQARVLAHERLELGRVFDLDQRAG